MALTFSMMAEMVFRVKSTSIVDPQVMQGESYGARLNWSSWRLGMIKKLLGAGRSLKSGSRRDEQV